MKTDVIVKKSKIHGKGVFAARNFKKGMVVLKWDTSHELTAEQVAGLPEKEKKFVPFVNGKYFLIQPPERFVNHSCDANTYAGNFCDIAKRDIGKGEEITSNYSETSGEYEKMKCNCGSKNCRRIIKAYSQIEKFAMQNLEADFFDNHVLLVVKEAKWLCGFYPEADKEVVETAALLHDIGQTPIGTQVNENHHLDGKKIAEGFLPSIGFPKEKIPKVLHCIEAHRTSKGPEPETIEAKIVASADNVSHFSGFGDMCKNIGKENALEKLKRDLKSKFMLPEAIKKAEKIYGKILAGQNKIEYSCFVDKNDKVLGKVARSEAHEKGLLHRAGVVLVFNKKGEVFLTKRSGKKKIFPNCIDCACSFHVKYGQSYAEAAKAELFEETKIKGSPKYLGKTVVDKEPDHMIVAVFKISHKGKIVLDPEEAGSGKFYSFKEADRIIKNEKTTHWLPEAWKIYEQHKNGS
ncbi:MAG: HD domain-containing protein [Candidatus ainarchaeum sp.]|nr:HD domain-containing protein [Candidatus ainarchaeum sp.]